MHLGSPDVAPDAVARAVGTIDHAGIAVRADLGGMAAAEELEDPAAGEEGIVVPGDGIVGHEGIGRVEGGDGISEGFHAENPRAI